MNRLRTTAASALVAAWSACAAVAADWRLGDRVYRDVTVKEVTARAVIIQHADGISQVLLADLPPEAQRRFGYDPAAAAAEEARLQREQEQALAQREAILAALSEARGTDDPSASRDGLDRLSRAFARPARVQREVDLRPELRELGLFSKSQGRRPSCSVFAVVGALEYLSSRQGEPVQFSEDYAIWATRQYLAEKQGERSGAYADNDAGFRLIDVVRALDRYGLAPRDAMPNTFGLGMERIDPPEPELIERARRDFGIRALRIDVAGNGSESTKRIVHCLNAGLPVVIGVGWPHENSLRAAPMISGQNPISMHAVTLAGYRTDEGGTNLRFVFKNSWGPEWGSGGYGWVTGDYLRQHLATAYLLETGPY